MKRREKWLKRIKSGIQLLSGTTSSTLPRSDTRDSIKRSVNGTWIGGPTIQSRDQFRPGVARSDRHNHLTSVCNYVRIKSHPSHITSCDGALIVLHMNLQKSRWPIIRHRYFSC